MKVRSLVTLASEFLAGASEAMKHQAPLPSAVQARGGNKGSRPRQQTKFTGSPRASVANRHDDDAAAEGGTSTGSIRWTLGGLFRLAGEVMAYRVVAKPLHDQHHADMVASLLHPEYKHPLITPQLYFEATGDAAGAAAKARYQCATTTMNIGMPFAGLFGEKFEQRMNAEWVQAASNWRQQAKHFSEIANKSIATQPAGRTGPAANPFATPSSADKPARPTVIQAAPASMEAQDAKETELLWQAVRDHETATAFQRTEASTQRSGVLGEFTDEGQFVPAENDASHNSRPRPERHGSNYRAPSVVDDKEADVTT